MLVVTIAACGDAASTTTAATSVALSEETAARAVATGVNSHGPGADDAAWVALAVTACEEGAWEWAVARRLAADFHETHPALNDESDELDATVWIIAAQSCPELVPPEALAKGPPD